jgi:hypothetical protein
MVERKKENRQIERPYTLPEFTAHCGMGHKALKNNDRPSAHIASFYLALLPIAVIQHIRTTQGRPKMGVMLLDLP